MDQVRPGRWQFSLRSLLLATAAVAVLLVPVAWVARQRQQMLLAQREILRAREVALQSVVREQERRHDAAQSTQELRRENDDLRRQLQRLRREVEQLKSTTTTVGNLNP